MGNTDKNKTKKCRRKIRIRLADPNVPDSYVCEIFDSSLENEEENSTSENTLSEEKPKNYFELLMPKKSRKNGVIETTKEDGVVRCSNDKEIFQKNRKRRTNKNLLTQSDDVKKEELKCETDSSEDESLFQIQKKYNLKNLDLKKENDCIIEVTDEKINHAEVDNRNAFTGIDPPRVNLLQKKALNILSYFPKTETSCKNKENCDAEEITVVRHSLKTCKTENTLKPVQEQDVKQTHQNQGKISLIGINKENVKLAPLFCKKENKFIDSAKQKARLEFLYKSAPSVVKKSENKGSENVFDFPTVPHVQQRNDSACWSLREIHLPLPEVSHSEEYFFKINKKFSLQIKHLNAVSNSVANYAIKINKELLSEVKYKYLQFNLDFVIDGLKEKKDRFLPRAQEIEKLKTRSAKQDSNEGFEELNILWTEKYKPRSCEILGNESVLRRLKKWLQSWKSFDEELKALVKTSRSTKNQKEEDNDSGNDFFDSETENYGLKAPGNVCIISGPIGCGKTALVYALANELEFGVLELNASSRRTGKRVLSDLQEATQSHKVHRVNLSQTDAFQNEVKKKKNRKKKNKKLEPKKILDQSNDSRISLILIEDADIVFDEHDEGFFSAIASLVQTSKRPLIFLTNEPNCHQLYNFKTEQCLILEMELPNFYISCAVLDVVSLLEGASFDKKLLESLVRQNNFDLRKSLLQLQFWIHSVKNSIDCQKKFDLGHLWWGLSKFLYNRDIWHVTKSKSRKRKRANDFFDSSDDDTETVTKKFKPDSEIPKNYSPPRTDLMSSGSNPSIESYFRVLDLTSALDGFSLPGSQEPIPGFDYKARDSLSLDENMEETAWSKKSLAEQVSEELINLSARTFVGKDKGNENRELNFVPPCWEEIRWRNSQERATRELASVVSLQRGRDNRSLHLDYLPALRNICRVERNRAEMNPKRKNRFYHYLNKLGLEIKDENIEINCEIFDR